MKLAIHKNIEFGTRRMDVRAEFLYPFLLSSFFYEGIVYILSICVFCSHSCHLVLGEVEDALQCFNKCLESGPGVCLDRKFIIEAADGLQKAQVPHFFPVILVTQYCRLQHLI
jgi:hypothetical protein